MQGFHHFRLAKSMMALVIAASMISACSTQKNNLGSGARPSQDSVLVWLKNKQFVFHAINAQPQQNEGYFLNPRITNLTTDYTLTFRNDSLIADLPYFGRSFTAPTNPAEGGIKFATNQYEIRQDTLQKKVWKIMVVPKNLSVFENAKDVQQIWLNIGLSGYGNLQINSVNRTPISFYGYIAKE